MRRTYADVDVDEPSHSMRVENPVLYLGAARRLQNRGSSDPNDEQKCRKEPRRAKFAAREVPSVKLMLASLFIFILSLVGGFLTGNPNEGESIKV